MVTISISAEALIAAIACTLPDGRDADRRPDGQGRLFNHPAARRGRSAQLSARARAELRRRHPGASEGGSGLKAFPLALARTPFEAGLWETRRHRVAEKRRGGFSTAGDDGLPPQWPP